MILGDGDAAETKLARPRFMLNPKEDLAFLTWLVSASQSIDASAPSAGNAAIFATREISLRLA
jgi:hypothetical protein